MADREPFLAVLVHHLRSANKASWEGGEERFYAAKQRLLDQETPGSGRVDGDRLDRLA